MSGAGASGPGEDCAIAWIAVDWGSSNLRAFAMGADGPVAEASSAAGMAGLGPAGFEPALLDLVGGWIEGGAQTEVIACGMVGARQGWVEADYAPVPAPPLGARPFARAPCKDPRLAVHVVPGLSQRAPADVMRGEETQIAGWLAHAPQFDGVVCLPGTHSKWGHLSAGEVVSFASHLTGELFDLLAARSVLRHSVAAAGWDEAAFAQAVEDAMSRPERIGARLFGLRAEALLDGLDPVVARARLSGFLVGLELAAARPYWLGREVALIGAPALTSAYRAALALQGLAPRVCDATRMTLAGLGAARARLHGGTRCDAS